jgi:hypothetical protein
MCDPIAIAGLAISATSSVLQFKAQNDMADAQAQAAADQYRQSAISAGEALNNSVIQENQRMAQESASAVDKQLSLRNEAARARGVALASGTQGSGGLSETLLLEDIERQRLQYAENVSTNLENQLQQSYWNKQGMYADAQSRINSARSSSSAAIRQANASRGSVLGLGLDIAGAGLGVANDYRIRNPKDPNSRK